MATTPRRFIVLVACGLFACGTSATKTTAPQTTRTLAAPPTARVPTRTEMLAALPGDAGALVVLDVRRLRRSSLAQIAWKLLRDSAKGEEMFDPLCGAEGDLSYALVAVNIETRVIWAWVSGLSRDQRLDCAKARASKAAHPHRDVRHGDYEVSTSDEHVDEALWLDSRTSLMVFQEGKATPLGEPALRAAISSGGGFAQSRIGALLDHVDFASGVAFVIDGSLTKQRGMEGLAASVEVDDGIRAQMYVKFTEEDHASELHAMYRDVLEKGVRAHVIDAGDTRLDGSGMAVSISLTAAQIDWWIRTMRARLADPNAQVTPPGATQTN